MHETNVLRMYDPSTYCGVLSIETNNLDVKHCSATGEKFIGLKSLET